MKKLLPVLTVLALAPFVLAACGSSNNSAGSSSTATSAPTGGGPTVKVTTNPDGQLAFTQTQISAKAGPATIELVNQAPLGHDLVLEDPSGNEVGRTDVITGSTASFGADLKPGNYTYYCSVTGHRQAGMQGTLTVK